MKGKIIFAFLLGVGVGGAGAYFYCQKKMLETIEEERVKTRDFYAQAATNEDVSEEEFDEEDSATEEETENGHRSAVIDVTKSEEKYPFKDIVLKNSVDVEVPEKPDIFDYAKISLKKKEEPEKVEEADEPEDKPINYKMRLISDKEYEDLAYSYETQDLYCYADGYVTDTNDRVLYKLKDMYPDASIDDRNRYGYIYVACDAEETVYEISIVNTTNYEDKYPSEV